MNDTRLVIDRLTEAMNRHDGAAVEAGYSADATLTAPDGTFEGREAAAQYMRNMLEAFPDLAVTVHGKTTEGDIGVDEWTMIGTNTGPLSLPDGTTVPATGRSVQVRGCDVSTVRDGLIVSHRAYFDQAAFFEQLGLAEASHETSAR